MAIAKVILLVLNLGVQIALLYLLVSLVKKNYWIAQAAQKSTRLNQEILELNTLQLSVVDDQIQSSRNVIEEYYRPQLVAYLIRDTDRQTDDLVFIMRNLGKGIASGIKVQLLLEPDSFHDDPWRSLDIILQEINSLSPGYQFLCPIDRAGKYIRSTDDDDDDDEFAGFPLAVNLVCEYHDPVTSINYRDDFPLRLNAPVGLCRQ